MRAGAVMCACAAMCALRIKYDAAAPARRLTAMQRARGGVLAR